MKAYCLPEDYFERHYRVDLAVFESDMLCGFTLTDSMRPPKRERFRGLAEFVICQFELNLLSQAIYTHHPATYTSWRAFSAPFADPRLCFSGHGMGSHMPYSILRFAQQPSAAPGTAPIPLNLEILRSYTSFFLGNYLQRFCSQNNQKDFSRDRFFEKLSTDHDCRAYIFTQARWESKHVLELLD